MKAYGGALRRGELQPDHAQRAAVQRLQRIHSALLPANRWQRLWRRLSGHQLPVRGLYLWGGVGRGKTRLMDLLCQCLAADTWRREHFHRFMRDIPRQLEELSGQADPLAVVAARIAERSQLLCLDEFLVLDIGDAMILKRLLQALFENGIVLVTTANIEPQELYRDGLQRQRFLPAIELLCEHCEIHHMAAGEDYRLQALAGLPLYYSPLDDRAERALAEHFQNIAGTLGADQADASIELNGRQIALRRVADDVIWFDFVALCDGPRSQNDYLELAQEYHTVLLSGVPCLAADCEDQTRRFINLVDVLYDSRINLVLSAAVVLEDLYKAERLAGEFERTRSRLVEMRSREYLAQGRRG